MTTTPDPALRHFDDNAQHIARRQYLQPGDGDIAGMFRRIAAWVAGAEAGEAREHWAQRYYDLMAEKKFCPGGRVLAGAGTQHGNVLNCFVQGATEHAPESFGGVMEVARKLALVTKVGGGNGVNLDVYAPRSAQSRPDAGVRGWVYMAATHPDVTDFVEGLMRPPTQPDGDKAPVAVRNWTRVVYGEAVPTDLVALARQNGVQIVRALPEGVQAVADDMGGIIDAARAVAETARVGVEPRIDLSPMRPEGAPIKGSGGTSSGPVSFLLEIFDNFLEWANRGGETSGPVNTLRFVYAPVLRVVRQGGTRRGAGMATIAIEHPDVLDFLTAKDLDREAAEGDISTFNISILVSEKFWQALERDSLWHVDVQEVPGKYYLAPQDGLYDGRLPALPDRAEDGARGVPLYRTAPQGRYNPADKRPGVPAKWLWDQIAEHAWSTGEPGLIFVDRVNEHSALKNLGKRYEIRSTNPCLAPGTMIFHQVMSEKLVTPDGGEAKLPHGVRMGFELQTPVEELVGQTVEVFDPLTTQWYETEFRVTGENQPVLNIVLANGESVSATPYHTFFLDDQTKIEARNLKVGDRLLGRPTRFSRGADLTLQEDFTITAIEDTGTAEKVYCCTVQPHHRFMLANGIVSGNCGEIPLTVGEPCDLGAINLAAYVKGSAFDYAGFRADVRTCVRFLDDVLDVNVFALEDNRVASQDLRRLGLGVMGLADALIKLGLRYDSEAGRQAIHDIMTALREEAVAESERLGKERGHYAVYTRSPRKIPHAARRNVAVLTVAPTGTTSMLMGVSSGIEPVFSPFIWRKIGSEYRALLHPLFMELLNQYPPAANMDDGQGGWNWDRVTEAVSENHGSVVGLAFIPEALQQVFVCAHDISPVDHVRMQGTVQRAFDEGGQHAANSLSKTINLSNSATVQDVQEAYAEAYRTGCKGITVYRDGSRQFQVLSTSKKKEKKAEDTVAAEAVAEVMGESPQPAPVAAQPEAAPAPAAPAPAPTPRPAASAPAPVYERPTRLSGITDMVKLTDPTSGHRRSFLVTVNHLNGKPVEVMVISGRAGDEANADSEALGRVVSIALQHGVPAQAIIKTLRGINGGLYGSYNGRLVGSKADLIAVALDTFAGDMDAASLPPLAGGSVDAPAAAPAAPSGVSVEGLGRERCPVCEEKAVIREEGCLKCQACGYSKCG
ncbi:ribonucleotide reductase N-terminal alpha domain-containing protein [Deinococcus sp. MIMF12]|uniref:Ribonucleoside-diphosphate reductase n=1 Tax=Deinococcus rhizophilus TaxID=3049544 RepID=A0ABT7JDM1_9DEIO|nr:ribonucleotide reductase N-terminal alpha domain-containing protein [Deinococcus rhizophilus]MDL2343154.1 ribonucleotide reductase N-terminal alpha domain-containing protein [Deinococcus rhizophilus]